MTEKQEESKTDPELAAYETMCHGIQGYLKKCQELGKEVKRIRIKVLAGGNLGRVIINEEH